VLPTTGLSGAVWSMTVLYIAVVLGPGLIYVGMFFRRHVAPDAAQA
jgi:hypothetical protein